jgi:tetratricopeptide (TPR) repeat protein
VARHLVAAGQLVDEDPQAALAQARAARRLAARIGPVREAAGIAAYAAGEWAEALAELRAARRLTGDATHLPIMADCERALGRADRALDLLRSPEIASLPRAVRVEAHIVESGARRDLRQPEAALVALQGPDLDRRVVEEWTPRLWYAHAEALLALGRTEEARDWFAAAASTDEDGVTDADERMLELDGVTVLDATTEDDGQ